MVRLFLSTLSILLVPFLLAGCAESSSPISCSHSSCGPFGTCVQGACQCEPGHQPTPDGAGCVPFVHDECEGVTCSGLGECSVQPLGPYGLDIPVCECQPNAVQSEDLMDCIDPCVGVDCSPGTCSPDQFGEPECTCPAGFDPLANPPVCVVKTRFSFEAVYDPYGQAFIMGTAWLESRSNDQGETLQSTLSWLLPNAQEGGEGSILRSVGRYDLDGRLVEVVQDHQPTFGRFNSRRRLHYLVEREDGDPVGISFESNIQERIWHDRLDTQVVPLPMADTYDYPTFSLGCFDPFFYQALGRAMLDSGEPEQTVQVLYPGFVLPVETTAVLSGDETQATVELPEFDIQADFEVGYLSEVRFGEWAALRPLPTSTPLELNFRPLPHTPIDHDPPPLPEVVEEAVTFPSSDGTLLSGTLTVPLGAPQGLATLLVPGVFYARRDKAHLHSRIYADLAATLADAGFASLCFDGRGAGESEGEATASLARIEQDLDAAFAFLLQDPRFNRVALGAHGFATPLALAAAHRLGPAGLFLLAPTGDSLETDTFHRMERVMTLAELDSGWLDAYREWHQADMAGLKDGSVTNDWKGRSAQFWQALLNRDPLDVGGLSLPVQVIQGDQDMVLPTANLDLVADALETEGCPVERHPMADLSHHLSPGQTADLWESIHLPWNLEALVSDAIAAWLVGLN